MSSEAQQVAAVFRDELDTVEARLRSIAGTREDTTAALDKLSDVRSLGLSAIGATYGHDELEPAPESEEAPAEPEPEPAPEEPVEEAPAEPTDEGPANENADDTAEDATASTGRGRRRGSSE